MRELHRGEFISYRLAGAGGYGEPRERDPSAVIDDLRDGFISPTLAAVSVWGGGALIADAPELEGR